jgi:hypothetical protein
MKVNQMVAALGLFVSMNTTIPRLFHAVASPLTSRNKKAAA